jgi:2-polyprenyl-3-methyl-5-hydroxy-6-metoxy-1,4-benzoquinol methylase
MNEREYDRMYAVEDHHWWYAGLHDLVLRFVRAEHRDRGALGILDAGCGTGRLCQLMAPLGRVEGCDLSERALAHCRARGVSAFRSDLSEAELGENRYDVITAIDVLYHRAIPDDSPVLERFYRALKPGGLLVLNLVAHEFLRSTHDIAVHTRKRYTRNELLPLLVGRGFRVEKASYRLGFLFIPIACYRVARRLLHAGGDEQFVVSDVRLPHRGINSLLLQLVLAENRVIGRGAIPFGSSLFMTARKPLSETG